MLEIVRGRHWVVAHTVLDGENGPPTDLSQFSAIVCHIREKIALRNRQGFFEHKLVATPAVSFSQSVYYLKLSVAAVKLLHTGDYTIDVVAQNPDGSSESLLDPEPVRVVNRPSQPIVVVVEPPPPPPVQPPNPDPTPGGEPPPDVTPPPTPGPGPGPFTAVTYDPLLPLGVLEFTIDGSVVALHGPTARFSFWHSGSNDKRANGVCYSVTANGITSNPVFVRGGYRPAHTSDLDLVSKMLPVPWSPSAVAMEAMFEIARTPNVDQVVRVWAANNSSTPQATPITQITAFDVACGRWKALNFKKATALEEAVFSGGVHNNLDVAGAFTTAGRTSLKSLYVSARDSAQASGTFSFSTFTGLRRLAFDGNASVIGIRAENLALQFIPTEERLAQPSVFYNCTLSDAALNQLYTDLSSVPNNGRLIFFTGFGGSDTTIATGKGYTLYSSYPDYHTRNNL